ncbi:DeoR/GlpR family DNA-binding transcription regulator [Paramicrobacterium agarici]|nr:DeoR/GlpR family DNA-binding transcription regulator [Microbacterium agarici]
MRDVNTWGESLRHGGAERRRILILERLFRDGHVAVHALSEEFAVAEMTIRRDLKQLADEGELELVHGGARLLAGRQPPAGFSRRTHSNSLAKKRVAEAVKTIVPRDGVVGVDAGTTAHACAVEFAPEFTGCVISHSVPVLASMLEWPEIRVIGVGGDLLHENQAMVGPGAVAALRELRIDVLVLGASAVNEDGLYVHSSVELATKRAMIDAAGEVILATDATKANASGAVRVCGLERVSRIATDREWEPGIADKIAAAGVSFVLA